MRGAFSAALVEMAKLDKNILLLTGDHGYSLFDEFRNEFPDQFINAGIAEQNMVGMAAGLAKIGFRPFVYGLAAFVPVRTVEQIKLDIAHDRLPVVLLGDGAGFVYSHLGTSHQSTEDVACTRAIPELEILSPADRFEMRACMNAAYSRNGPVYIRMGKADRGDIHHDVLELVEPGTLIQVLKGSKDRPGLIATGSMVKTAVDIASSLNLSVWSSPYLKPLLVKSVCEAATCSSGLVTLEEHSIIGGLGSAVAEITSQYLPTNVLRIGVPDQFSKRCGTYNYLLKEHGLDNQAVKSRICQFFNIS